MPFMFHRSRKILHNAVTLFKERGGRLTALDRKECEKLLEDLDQAIASKNGEQVRLKTKNLEKFVKMHFKKGLWEHIKELVFALVFALVIAFLIRQFWFELYEVPTGSMRPTIEELDRMVVSKTTFGINFPFRKDLTFFKPDDIKRAGVIVFTVAGMDVADGDTVYFYLFPGKKRYVKRTMGKPGDTVYFYGGQLYGVDKDGNPILELADPTFLKENKIEKIDHVPYITFEGKTALSTPLTHGVYGSATFSQMNQPVAKLQLKSDGSTEGMFFNGKTWVKDNPAALRSSHSLPESYSDLWGIRNYAMARLLTPSEALRLYSASFNDTSLILELHHTPSLTYPTPEMRRGEVGRVYPAMSSSVALIPLQETHLNQLRQNLYTSRFFVKNGKAYRYQEDHKRPQRPEYDVPLPGVPDGCYEFYYGKGYEVHFLGIRSDLAKDHPLYSTSPELLQKLFNLGIGFNQVFQPMAQQQPFMPQRFSYYRDGDLYVMGGPLLTKDDPTLKQFVNNELQKQANSSTEKPYVAFVDQGPPLKENGQIDVDFIRSFGLKIPEDGLLALGDNYAMSADSRDFGFVPTQNLRGSPSFTFWPFSKRIGSLPQPPYPWLTLPNFLVWTVLILIGIGCYLYFKNKHKHPIFKKDKRK